MHKDIKSSRIWCQQGSLALEVVPSSMTLLGLEATADVCSLQIGLFTTWEGLQKACCPNRLQWFQNFFFACPYESIRIRSHLRHYPQVSRLFFNSSYHILRFVVDSFVVLLLVFVIPHKYNCVMNEINQVVPKAHLKREETPLFWAVHFSARCSLDGVTNQLNLKTPSWFHYGLTTTWTTIDASVTNENK